MLTYVCVCVCAMICMVVAFIAVIVRTIHVNAETEASYVFTILFGTIATAYALYWDIFQDWSLFEITFQKYKIPAFKFRAEKRFTNMQYLMVSLLNFVFRIAWALSLFPESFGMHGIDNHYYSILFGMTEILRRCIWNIIRIENEHLNNCGKYRIVREIPLMLL